MFIFVHVFEIMLHYTRVLGVPWYPYRYSEYHGTNGTMVPLGIAIPLVLEYVPWYVHVYKYNITPVSQKQLEIQALSTCVRTRVRIRVPLVPEYLGMVLPILGMVPYHGTYQWYMRNESTMTVL